MAYNLYAGDSARYNPSFVRIGEVDEYAALVSLAQRQESFFLELISNLYARSAFSCEESAQAMRGLLPLLELSLPSDELALLHKLIAVLAYSATKGLFLLGEPD